MQWAQAMLLCALFAKQELSGIKMQLYYKFVIHVN